jgi:tetratricopeptide (TPR) repeat protein
MSVSRPSTTLLAAGLIVLAAILVYGNSLDAPFVFDDAPAIIENPSILRLSALGAVLSPPTTAGSAAGRPLVNLSLALNYAAGGLEPRGYHLVNLGLHALAALTLFGSVRRTLQQPVMREVCRRDARPLATVIALLWTTHPLLTESVTCTVQRTELLGALFLLLALYSFIRTLEPGAAGHWSFLAVAACYTGVTAKEIVAVAPLLVLAYDRLFNTSSPGEAWRRRWRLHLMLAGSWVLLGWLIASGAQRGGTVGFGFGVSAWEYLLTQCHAIVLYLKLSFWPYPLVLDYGTDVVRRLGDVLPQAALLVLLAGATLWGLCRRLPAAFAGFWFFAILAPSSSVVPLVSQPIAEHRMYLPLAAVLALVVLATHRWLGRRSLLLWVAIAVPFAGLTVRRNADYHSPIAIWTDTVAKRPGNSRAHSLLSLALTKAGRHAEALAASREAARLAPASPEMHYNLGNALLQSGQPAEAVTIFRTALRLRPAYAEAHCNLGVALLTLRQGREAYTHFQAALQLRPDFADAHYNLGNLFAQTGRLALAIPSYAAALAAAPNRADAHFNLGKALLESGRPAEAILHFETVLHLTPQDADAALNLALARQSATSPIGDPGGTAPR